MCETVEGLPLEHFLGLAARLTHSDRRMLIGAGEALAAMPVTAGLFADGALSWSQVRGIVSAAKGLRVAQREDLDARVAATIDQRGGLEGFDADALVWAVSEAADELRGPKAARRAEQRQRDSAFLSRQSGLDGWMKVYGELDPLLSAAVNNALDAAAGRPPSGSGQDTDQPGEGEPRWTATSKARQDAAALGKICADWLGGDTNRPARPLLVAHIDTNQTSVTPSGMVHVGVRGPIPRIAAATLDALACDATVRAVLFDGARPLAVTGKVNAADIPADTRFAVAARDRGCRFPGSHDPLGHTDIHHLAHRADGGDHHPDNLAALSRRHHTITHRHGWTLTLQPATAQLTATRRHRRWKSLPRGTPLSRPPPGRPPPGRPPDRASHQAANSARAGPSDPQAADPTLPF
ncbi:hypothetical protein BH23ACT8_BH23ACT8_18680 [soil metagenome]